VARDVLVRFSKGDPDAAASLYEEYGGAVFTVALSILNDRELAADATQQTFVKAWKSARTYDPDRPFPPWIYAIARRASIDIWRTERSRERSTSSDDVDVAETPPGIEHAWQRFEVRTALNDLSEEEREVIRLTHYDGYTHSQAAEVLGVSIGTIKSRSHRAHRRLAELLAHLLDQ
jgi:RNA polymerase sigma-70 factor (ECF subfamily)